MSKIYVPLSDTEKILEYSNEGVDSGIILPVGVDTERIELNVGALEKLGRLAGAKQLQLLTVAGERKPIEFTGGVQQDGSIVSMGGLRKPKRSYSTFDYVDIEHPLRTLFSEDSATPHPGFDQSPEVPQIYKADKLALYISKLSIEESIKDNQDTYERGIVDEKAWARYLDVSIKQGVSEAAFTRYCHSGGYGLFHTVSELAGKYLAVSLTLDRHTVGMFLWGGTGILRRTLQLNRVIKGEEPARNFNWSLFNGVRVDRAAITAVRSRISKTVRYRA